MNGSSITITGNLTDAPNLRFTASGTACATFTVVCNERRYDRDQGGYVEGEPSFVPVTVWKRLAENAADSLRKGQHVIVTGEIRQHSWESDNGERRSRLTMTGRELGVSLRFDVARTESSSAKGNVGTDRAQPSSDPWGSGVSPKPGSLDEPPF